jgi:hypothetical protein
MEMVDEPRSASRYESLRASRRAFVLMAPIVRYGLCVTGLAVLLKQVEPLVSDMQLTWGERQVVGLTALITLGAFGLGGWVAGWIVRAMVELIDVMVDQAEATQRAADLIQWHVVPALERAAVALERANLAPPASDGRALAIAGVRQAIGDQRWEQAERLIEAFLRDFPDAPEGPRLTQELAEAWQATIDDLKARLKAAREVNDPHAVIAFRDQLTQHLRGDPLRELDREVICWLMGLLQRRMRTGTVRADVAELAAKIADSFGDTPEGASLRASLPTLRRSAGLCPQCARPYRGIDAACPECLATARAAPRNGPTQEAHP